MRARGFHAVVVAPVICFFDFTATAKSVMLMFVTEQIIPLLPDTESVSPVSL